MGIREPTKARQNSLQHARSGCRLAAVLSCRSVSAYARYTRRLVRNSDARLDDEAIKCDGDRGGGGKAAGWKLHVRQQEATISGGGGGGGGSSVR